MHRFQQLLATGFLAVVALTGSGCSTPGSAHLSGRDVFVFLDLSASVDAVQRTLWKREASRLSASLANDSSIAVYAIHEHTMDAAQLFEAEIPPERPDGTRESAQQAKTARLAARKGALAALTAALDTGGHAPRTDIFSAIDRIRPSGAGRRLEIYFFSDMLNSTPDLNMELPGSLSRANLQDRLVRLAQRHSWHSGQLAGAEVYCLLNSVASGARAPATDRLTQAVFYRALFESLGARLMSYDTNLAALSRAAAQGGSNAARNE